LLEKNEEVRRIQEKERAERNAKLQEKIILKTDKSQCLAIDPLDSSCVANVGDFNTYIKLQRPLGETNLDTARAAMLGGLLRTRFFAETAKKSKLPVQKDVEETRHFLIENTLLGRSNLRDDFSKEELLAVYNKYYKRFFCDRNIKKIAMIGSTDSTYIDSIYREFTKIANIKSAKWTTVQKTFISTLPWIVSQNEDLPESINKLIDTLQIQGFCKIQLPFGYLDILF
jgi:hypothetical protein